MLFPSSALVRLQEGATKSAASESRSVARQRHCRTNALCMLHLSAVVNFEAEEVANTHFLTVVAHKPSIVTERVSPYSFRFPELSQPI